MRKYLLKIHKINKKIRDPSEFHSFLYAANRFLNTGKDHREFVEPLRKALKRIKNSIVLACILAIAACIRVESGFISKKDLRKFLKSPITRNPLLQYLDSFNISFLDAKIRYLLENDREFYSEELFKYIAKRNPLARAFILHENRELVPKQLNFMVSCKVFYGIQHFIQYLGHETRLLSFKAFEAFSFFFEEVISNETRLNEFLQECGALCIVSRRENTYCLNIDAHSIHIADVENFIACGWSFLPEKYEIVELVKSDDSLTKYQRLNEIVRHYAKNTVLIEALGINEASLCSGQKDCRFFMNIEEDESNFDHLFNKIYKKTVCDCYEI